MSANGLKVSQQLQAALIGSVRIQSFHQLFFDDIDVLGSRALKQSRLDQLVHRFEHEGCRRLDPLTWIPCEVSLAELQPLLTTALVVGDPKELVLPNSWRLHCFQGQHRIAAAQTWLAPGDLWWNFDLYDSQKLNGDCRRRLREHDACTQNFGDGEIFRNIRHYQQRGETEAAKEWLGRWSPTKCQEFNRIYVPKNNADEYRSLGERLDQILVFPALWITWYMGTHLPSLKCPEVRGPGLLTRLLIYIYRSLLSLYPQYMKHGSPSHVEIQTIWTHAPLRTSRGAALACQ